MAKVGDRIRILRMEGEPQYTGREGVIERISNDPWGDTALYGTWGGCSIYLGKDEFTVIEAAGEHTPADTLRKYHAWLLEEYHKNPTSENLHSIDVAISWLKAYANYKGVNIDFCD